MTLAPTLSGPDWAIALGDSPLQQRLRRLLRDLPVRPRDIADPTPDLGTLLGPGGPAAVLLDAAHAPAELPDEEDRPGVVVVASRPGPVERARLLTTGARAVLDADLPDEQLRFELGLLAQGPRTRGPALADFTSRNPAMREFLELVRRVLTSDSTLLVCGETGVGKERLAQAIHEGGHRARGPFISVNCAALPEQLLEGELFGHEKGAFTGAEMQRRGRFELADNGMIFLDEIGEMPPHLQVKLLTVLQRREVQRLGSERTRAVDVRVVAATNRDLAAEVAAGRFREDLFYRLNVITLEIPPLRQRPEDVPDLVGSFLRARRKALGRGDLKGVTESAMRALMSYSWPGNIRQLFNVIERALLLAQGSWIDREDLPELAPPTATPAADEPRREAQGEDARPLGSIQFDPLIARMRISEARKHVMEEFEHFFLERVLTRSRGSIQDAADMAGINPRTLRDLMRRTGLRKEDFKPSRQRR